MDIKKYIKECYELAREKGFYPDDSKIEDHLMGIVSEIGEAYESHRVGDIVADKRLGISITDYVNHITGVNIIRGSFDSGKYFDEYIKDSFEDELADVFIRLFNLMAHYKISPDDEWFIYGTKNYVGETLNDTKDISGGLLYLSSRVSKLKNDKSEPYTADLSMVLTNLESLCENLNIPIEKHIQAKHEYNKTREYLHGKMF